jgi:hypothetical protein
LKQIIGLRFALWQVVLCQEKVQIKMSKLFPSISVRIKL